MKRTGTDTLRWLLTIGIILILWSQVSAATAFALAPELSHAARAPGRLRQSNDAQNKLSCEDALENASAVKVGMRESEVLALLGEPGGRVENEWGYNFMACVSTPYVGEQKIIGLGIVFGEGVVKQIKYATIDAIGPAPGYKPTQKREKKRHPKSRKRAT